MNILALIALVTLALACGKSTGDAPNASPQVKPLEPSAMPVPATDAKAALRIGSPKAASAIVRSCQTDQDCLVISTYCGGWATINRKSESLARTHYDAIGAIKDCREGVAAKPNGHCETQLCAPEKVNH